MFFLFSGESEPLVECISGSPTIIETLTSDNLQFSISPQAFFQVNTEGAEKVTVYFLL
jgi:tRNA/tmRNA/rRNA uracil-C5-methylase (TrmA/RlmC/RlmD family)